MYSTEQVRRKHSKRQITQKVTEEGGGEAMALN